MKVIVSSSLEDNEVMLKSVLEPNLIVEGKTIKILDHTLADIYVVNSGNPNEITRPILTFIEIGGE